MKIMHLVLRPRFSGAEILARDLCVAQRVLGHETAFACIKPCEQNFRSQILAMEHQGVKTYLVEHEPTKLERLRVIRKAFTEFEPEVVFAHSIIPAAYARVADLPRKRVITVLHAASNKDYQGWKWLLSEQVLQHLSAGVVAVSELGAEDYRRKFSAQNKVRVIKNGVNLRGALQAAAARLDKSKGKIVLQIGRIVPVKGQHITIQAMADVVKAAPEARLLLAGLIEDHAYQQQLEAQVKELNIIQHVEFLGPRSDIFDLLAKADVYVMPSSAEAHSVAMLEALASGIPVVASDIETLSCFSNMPGVRCLPISDIDQWSLAISDAFKGRSTFKRDTSRFDITITAKSYLEPL